MKSSMQPTSPASSTALLLRQRSLSPVAATSSPVKATAPAAIDHVRTETNTDGTVTVYTQMTVLYPNGDHYTGESTGRGIRAGQGTLRSANGETYTGAWKKGMRHGRGVHTTAPVKSARLSAVASAYGELYEGDWYEDERHGQGVMKRNDGSRYDGAWKRGRMNGHGRQLTADGDWYEGQFEQGRYHGAGRLVKKNRDVYEGTFRRARFHGDGHYRYSSGGFYSGSWFDGEPHGIGRRVWASGAEYEGEFAEGRLHGRGIYRSPTGDVYVGEFEGGWPAGQGTLTYANGDVYTGGMGRGVPSGRGRFTYAAGGYYDGDYMAQLRCGVSSSSRAAAVHAVRDSIARSANWRNHMMEVYFGRRALSSDASAQPAQAGRIIVGSPEDVKWLAADPDARSTARTAPAYDGSRHGVGVRVWTTGARYEGEWWQGSMHGKGQYTLPARYNYEGMYQHDKPHGRGRAEYTNDGLAYTCPLGNRHDGTGKCVYDGDWDAGAFHGHGILTCCDGRGYMGSWRAGHKHGAGVLTYVPDEAVARMRRRELSPHVWHVSTTSSARFEGKFDEDVRHGSAKLTLVNGDTYEGELQHGRWEGVVRINLIVFALFKSGARVEWTQPTLAQTLQLEDELQQAAAARAATMRRAGLLTNVGDDD